MSLEPGRTESLPESAQRSGSWESSVQLGAIQVWSDSTLSETWKLFHNFGNGVVTNLIP